MSLGITTPGAGSPSCLPEVRSITPIRLVLCEVAGPAMGSSRVATGQRDRTARPKRATEVAEAEVVAAGAGEVVTRPYIRNTHIPVSSGFKSPGRYRRQFKAKGNSMSNVLRNPAPWMAVSIVMAALASLPSTLMAQRAHASLEMGSMNYDAGGDLNYPLLGVRWAYDLGSGLRAGIGAGRSRIGAVVGPGIFPGDETVWRGYGDLSAVVRRPFKESTLPIVDHLSFSAGVNAGMVHVSGRRLNQAAIDSIPYPAVFSSRYTGPSVGAEVVASIEVAPWLSLDGRLRYWRDFILGGALDDWDRALGFSVAW